MIATQAARISGTHKVTSASRAPKQIARTNQRAELDRGGSGDGVFSGSESDKLDLDQLD